MTVLTDRCREFRRLHKSGCFVIPNPWDPGSARTLARLGFPALATTSSGFAWSLGRRDNSLPLQTVLAHLRSIAESVEVPVNADFEGGFAVEPAEVGSNVVAAARTGVAGLWIPPAIHRVPCTTLPWRSSGFVRPAVPSTRAARGCCSLGAPKDSLSGAPTWPKQSAG
jgi:2-methylisocitrate lyase-like PEP mutase family enzyme